MRCKVGVTGTASAATVRYTDKDMGQVDVLAIACGGIQAAMPQVLDAVRDEPALRQGLAMMSYLGTRDGADVVVSLVYGCPLDVDEWRAAAERAQQRWVLAASSSSSSSAAAAAASLSVAGVSHISLIAQAKGQKVVVGKESVVETYSLSDGRCLAYKHVFGHFSNPNAFACAHTLDWLSGAVRSLVGADHAKTRDLLELYCGNGNHTGGLGAPLPGGAGGGDQPGPVRRRGGEPGGQQGHQRLGPAEPVGELLHAGASAPAVDARGLGDGL